jgi:hypothetical protein
MERDFFETKNNYEITNKKLIQMRISMDEERHRWATRDSFYKKIEFEKKELEIKYTLAKENESEFKRKMSIISKKLAEDKGIFEAQNLDFQKQLTLFQSDEYVIKRLEACIKNTKDGNGNFSGSNSLYESFMKMNVGGDDGSMGSTGSPRKGGNINDPKNPNAPGSPMKHLSKSGKGVYKNDRVNNSMSPSKTGSKFNKKGKDKGKSKGNKASQLIEFRW